LLNLLFCCFGDRIDRFDIFELIFDFFHVLYIMNFSVFSSFRNELFGLSFVLITDIFEEITAFSLTSGPFAR
jgi:hypothetical protein